MEQDLSIDVIMYHTFGDFKISFGFLFKLVFELTLSVLLNSGLNIIFLNSGQVVQ